MSIGTTATTPKAAKQHRCEVCGRAIEVGERYTRVKGLWEHEWQNWAAHTICLDIYHDGSGEQEITHLSWQEIVEIASTTEALDAFVARFPPEDDEDGAFARSEREAIIRREALAATRTAR